MRAVGLSDFYCANDLRTLRIYRERSVDIARYSSGISANYGRALCHGESYSARHRRYLRIAGGPTGAARDVKNPIACSGVRGKRGGVCAGNRNAGTRRIYRDRLNATHRDRYGLSSCDRWILCGSCSHGGGPGRHRRDQSAPTDRCRSRWAYAPSDSWVAATAVVKSTHDKHLHRVVGAAGLYAWRARSNSNRRQRRFHEKSAAACSER